MTTRKQTRTCNCKTRTYVPTTRSSFVHSPRGPEDFRVDCCRPHAAVPADVSIKRSPFLRRRTAHVRLRAAVGLTPGLCDRRDVKARAVTIMTTRGFIGNVFADRCTALHGSPHYYRGVADKNLFGSNRAQYRRSIYIYIRIKNTYCTRTRSAAIIATRSCGLTAGSFDCTRSEVRERVQIGTPSALNENVD